MSEENNLDALSYEAAVTQIEALLAQLEQSDVPLEEAIKQFEQGTKLIRHCEKILAQTEQKIVGLTNTDGDAANNSGSTSSPATTSGASDNLDDDIPF